jgi:hypothetical protein
MSATTTQLLSSGEFCKLHYDTIPVKSASTNVYFYTNNSKNAQNWVVTLLSQTSDITKYNVECCLKRDGTFHTVLQTWFIHSIFVYVRFTCADCNVSDKTTMTVLSAYQIIMLPVTFQHKALLFCKDGHTLVTLPRIVTPYRDSVDGTRDRVTYQKLVTR